MALIPVTILTGFLGAGKTTLLKRILQEPHGHRIAVIENEFGPENIDHAILIHDTAEQIVEMNNGCVCCTVRGDLIAALGTLSQKRLAGALQFDRVIIETTGIANPGPVAQTFFMDDSVASHYLLDAIVTVVDAKHAMRQLDAHTEAQSQVGFADKILLSKTDLTDAAEVDRLTRRLTRMNPRAPIRRADFGRLPLTEVLDLRGFHLHDRLELDHDFLQNQAADAGHAHHACSAHCHHPGHHAHDDVAAFAFTSLRSFDSAKLNDALGRLVQEYGPQLLRYKGVLAMEGGERKVIFQGVHQTMGTDLGAKWPENAARETKIVFIGKKLPQSLFINCLEQCLV